MKQQHVNAIAEWLGNQDTDTQRRAHNQFDTYGEYVYDSIEDYARESAYDTLEAMRALFFGEVKSWYDCVTFNAYGNLVSWDGLDSSECEELAVIIYENEDAQFEYEVTDGDYRDRYEADSAEEAVEMFVEEYGLLNDENCQVIIHCTGVEL